MTLTFQGQPVSAVLFDMDGLLVDTEPFWEEAEIQAFADIVGLNLNVSDCKETMGMRLVECIQYWQVRKPQLFQADSAGRLQNRILDLMEERIRSEARALPGVAELLDYLAEQPIALAIVSSSDYRLIQAVVETLDWHNYFGLLKSAQGEKLGKPHPAVYLSAARELGVSPDQCLALEDSLNGVIAVKAARMRCIAVPYPLFRDHPGFGIADQVLHSLNDLDYAQFEMQS